jgi:hypothetical protein
VRIQIDQEWVREGRSKAGCNAEREREGTRITWAEEGSHTHTKEGNSAQSNSYLFLRQRWLFMWVRNRYIQITILFLSLVLKTTGFLKTRNMSLSRELSPSIFSEWVAMVHKRLLVKFSLEEIHWVLIKQ